MREMRRVFECFCILALVLWASIAVSGEWKGLKIGVSVADDAKKLLGQPASTYPDYLLFNSPQIKSVLVPDTVVVNLNSQSVIESLFIFPRWGLTDVDIVEIFGEGERMTYGEFLKQKGITSFGAGTQAAEKLHYLPLTLPCEAYPDKRILAVYDDRGVTSGEQIVKLVIFY